MEGNREMKIEEKKNKTLGFLDDLEKETAKLLERIFKARKEIQKVNSEKDVDMFIKNNDLEKDFKHITLHL